MNATVCFCPRMGDGFPRAQLSDERASVPRHQDRRSGRESWSAGRSARSENERYEKGNKERSSTRSATRTSAERAVCCVRQRFDLLVEVESSRCFVCEFLFLFLFLE